MTRTAQMDSLGGGLPKTQHRLRRGAKRNCGGGVAARVPTAHRFPSRRRGRSSRRHEAKRNSGGNHAYAEGYWDASDRR